MLVFVILVVLVLAVLSRAIVLTASQQGFGAVAYLSATEATLLAETANLIVLDRLAEDPQFSGDFDSQSLQHMDGTFKIDFVTPGTELVTPSQSVNNLLGTEAVNGPRGKLTVPPGTLDLVVEVETTRVKKRFESLIQSPKNTLNQAAIGSAGKIHLNGNISVDGIQSVTSDEEIEGGIHSSLSDPLASNIIRWSENEPSDKAEVSGAVTTTSPSSSAISMTGANIDGGQKTGVATPPLREVDIETSIASKSGGGSLSVPSSGSFSVGSGEHYVAGDVDIAGDLILDGSDIYINGDLEVNGSIRGTGTVWVKGDTYFRGDSAIRVGSGENISLLSHGNVELEGFKGLDYLQRFVDDSNDADLALDLDHSKQALEQIEASVESSSAIDFKYLSSADAATQPWRRVLSDPNPVYNGIEDPPPGYRTNTLGHLADALERSGRDEPTNNFMVERLRLLQRFNKESVRSGGDAPARVNEVLAKWKAGDLSDLAYFDYISEYSAKTGDELPPGTLEELFNFVKQMSFDKLGTSSFQGTVITDGTFVAKHEVNVVGQIHATGKNKDARVLSPVVGVRVGPGDVFIGDGCHVTYCHEYVENAGAKTGGTRWEVGVWIE